MIVEIADLMALFRGNLTFRKILTRWTVNEIIEALIEEPLGPKDSGWLMDDICNLLDESSEITDVPLDTLDMIEMTLETIQLEIDRRITSTVVFPMWTYGYKVTKWLSPTTVLISINPNTTD